MKKIFIKMAAVLLILAGFVSCAEENANVREIPFDELPVSSEIPVNYVTDDGIEFSFCLLNKKGEPATVFSEGENFRFYFKCTNSNVNNELEYANFLTELMYNGFWLVISQQNDTVGYPVTREGVNCTDRYDTFPFYGENNSYEIIVAWSDNRDIIQDNLLCGFTSLHRENLPKGKYYTGFTHEFRFFIKGKHGRYDIPVSFKIDFEIKEDVKKFGL